MNIIQAILLGILQGLTEFIPVSSSGHLIIGAKLFGLEPSATFSFDVSLHIGTFLALAVFFRRDLIELARNFRQNKPLIAALAIATLPAVVAGLLLGDYIEANTRSIWLVITALAAGGLLMLIADRLSVTRKGRSVSPKAGLGIGLAQVLALIPGVSRSGATILAGRALGFDYRAATRFSFLMALPVTFGAAVKVTMSESGLNLWQTEPAAAIAGLLAAAVSGWLAIGFMMNTLSKIGLKWFGVYRLVLAALLVLLLQTNLIGS